MLAGKKVIYILADSYAKGCKICSVKEKKLGIIFSDESFRYPDDKESFKKDCIEILRKKGRMYSVHFKKKLIGLYVLKCEGNNLILVNRITHNMEDIVRAEVEKTIKLLVHMAVVNSNYYKAVWNDEIIDRDYVKQHNSYWLLFLSIMLLNIVVLSMNIAKGSSMIITVCMAVVIIMYLVIGIIAYKKRK